MNTKEYNSAYYQGHKQRLKKYKKNHYLSNKKYYKKYNKEYYKKNHVIKKRKERVYDTKEYRVKKRLEKRTIVINYYSDGTMCCKCCGEKEIKFLSVDHINGGGNKHRKELKFSKDGSGGDIYRWLIKNNYPKGFQILCHNCNMAKGFYGTCPHINK